MKCVRCNRPIGQAAVMVGVYAYGPKCARLAGFIVSAPVAATKQPPTDDRQMPLGFSEEMQAVTDAVVKLQLRIGAESMEAAH